MNELTGNPTDNESKKTYIEILRVFACFFVIFNHTGPDGFFLFSSYPGNSIQYWIYLSLSVFCKFAVPAFFAISGSLLIPKNESIKKIYRYRILRFSAVLILFSVFYYLFYNRVNISNVSFRQFFFVFLVNEHSIHLWYLYTFIAFLISLPLIKVFARSMNNKHRLYFTLCAFVFSSLQPLLEYALFSGEHTINECFDMTWLTSMILVYPCIGYYLGNIMNIEKINGKKLLYLWLADIVCIGISCILTFCRARTTGVCTENESQLFHQTFVLINVIVIFITVRYIDYKYSISGKIKKTVESVGSCTFGIYLFHLFIKDILDEINVLPFLKDILHFNYMAAALIYCLIIMAVGYVLTLILKKIPVFSILL